MKKHRDSLLPERFMVVAFTEHQPEKRSLGAAWPQHMTVLPWMQTGRLQATDRLARAMADFGPVRADIIGHENFVPGKDIPVWTLGPCDILQRLHKQVREAVLKNGTEWASGVDGDRPYHPHVTKKPGPFELVVGDRLVFSELSVIGNHQALGKIVFDNVSLAMHETAA